MNDIKIIPAVNHHNSQPAWIFTFTDDKGKAQSSAYFKSEQEVKDFLDKRAEEKKAEDFIKPFIHAEYTKEQSEKAFESMWLIFWSIMDSSVKTGLVNAINSKL